MVLSQSVGDLSGFLFLIGLLYSKEFRFAQKTVQIFAISFWEIIYIVLHKSVFVYGSGWSHKISAWS